VKILKKASAGTLESSDAFVEITPAEQGLDICLESVVEQQFGDEIRAIVRQVLADCDVTDAKVHVTDRGALDCVLRARVETAAKRAGGEG